MIHNGLELSLLIDLGPRPECAAALARIPGYRVWQTPDMPRRCAVTYGGTEAEARAAVVVGLHERLIGDWSYEAILTTAPAVRPCAWCVKRNGYAH